MKKFRFSLFLAAIFSIVTSAIQAEVITLKSMCQIEKEINELLSTTPPEDILVAFNIDMTLIQPKHPAASYPALMKYDNALKDIFAGLSPIQKDRVKTLVAISLPQRLVERDTPKII